MKILTFGVMEKLEELEATDVSEGRCFEEAT